MALRAKGQVSGAGSKPMPQGLGRTLPGCPPNFQDLPTHPALLAPLSHPVESSCPPRQATREEDINFSLPLYEPLEPMLYQMPQVCVRGPD